MEVAEITDSPCTCDSIGRTDLRQCPEHFRLWRGDRRLKSVGRIISESFPMDPSIRADKLENARDRGSEVDVLFARYVLGELSIIPSGMRSDAVALLLKLVNWYERQNFSTVEVQVLLGGEDYGGVLDFRFDGLPVDLKCTYNVLHTHRLQVAAYASMLQPQAFSDVVMAHGMGGAILHITERLKEPKLVPLKSEDYSDWRVLLEHWRMVERRAK
jgi:hypothetical protein